MRPIQAVLIAALIGTPALAQEGRPVTGKCVAGKCDVFQVLTRDVVGVGPRGRLVKSRIRAWTTQDGRVADESEEDGYAYCSRTVPALVGGDESGATANLLAPLSPDEYDQNPNSYATYFEVCHGLGRDILRSRDAGAEDLGYVAVRQRPAKIALTRPSDALSLGEETASPRRPPSLRERMDRDLDAEDERMAPPPPRGRLRSWPGE